MTPLRIWIRRCSAARFLPALIAAMLVLVHSRSGWTHDWLWAFDWLTVCSHVLAVLSAGLAAHDIGARATPTLTLLASTSKRGLAGLSTIGVATWLVGLAAWAVAAAYVALRVALAPHGDVPSLWWPIGETAATLLAAALLGTASGLVVRGRVAGPVAAIGLALLSILATVFFGWDFVFRPGGVGTDLIGWERTPQVAASFMALHALIAGVGLLIILSVSRARRVAAAVAVVVVAAGAVLHSNVTHRYDPFRVADRPVACRAADGVTVCGPEDAEALLPAAASRIAAGRSALRDSGIDWATQYAWLPAPLAGEAAGRGVVSVSSDDGGYIGDMTPADVAATLAFPRLCAAYTGDVPPSRLLAEQETVRNWAEAGLSQSAPGPAPEAVKSAFRSSQTCAGEGA